MIRRGVVVHHSQSARTTTPEEIDRWHRNRPRPFRCIGYHALVRQRVAHGKVSVVYCGYLGRQFSDDGAHCKYFNTTHLGVCLIGNFNKYPPSDEMLTATAELIHKLASDGLLVSDYEVKGHRDMKTVVHGKTYNDTDCPGTQFDLDRLTRLL